MAFIEWSRKNAVGVSVIDEQHRELFGLLNRLHESVVQGKEQGELHAILDELVDYTVYHFQTEEDLLREYDYPDFAAQKRSHDTLARTVLEMQAQLREGSASLSFELLDFLHSWLMDHTVGLDREMGPHLNARGVL